LARRLDSYPERTTPRFAIRPNAGTCESRHGFQSPPLYAPLRLNRPEFSFISFHYSCPHLKSCKATKYRMYANFFLSFTAMLTLFPRQLKPRKQNKHGKRAFIDSADGESSRGRTGEQECQSCLASLFATLCSRPSTIDLR
jgi:hypothetical protein